MRNRPMPSPIPVVAASPSAAWGRHGAILREDARPRLAAGARLRFDDVRGTWILQARQPIPLRDDIALEVLRRLDGAVTLGSIIDCLMPLAGGDRDHAVRAVTRLLRDLAEQDAVRL